MKKFIVAAGLLSALSFTGKVYAQDKKEATIEVGGAPMYASRNIVENALNSRDHTTLVAAVKAAGLTEVLQGKGPFTVFAPTNAAFDQLPSGTVDQLLQPENRSKLTSVLKYHVVPGKISSRELMEWVRKGNGTMELTTVQGDKLWVMENGDGIWLKDGKGNRASITVRDVNQSNGVIHVIDAVLMPQ